MRALSLCVFTLALSASDSTNIHGLVLDPSARPIEGARVTCSGRSIFTNSEGRFVLSGAADCDAGIVKAGFDPVAKKLSAAGENRITMPVSGPVESIVVSATRAQTTPEQAAVAADVIPAEQLAARDYVSIADALREIPSVGIVDSGRRGSVTSVFTRGASTTSTLVLLDGVPLNDPGGQINLAHLTSPGIDRIEVVRGPESALFGAEASAGVVQLFTKRGDPEETVPHGFVSYERGNFATDRWIAGVNGGLLKRLDYSLTADQIHTAGEFQNDFYRDTAGTANLGYRLSDATQVRGIFRMYDAHLGTPGQVGYKATDYAANQETRDSTVAVRVDDSRGAKYFQTFSFDYNRLRDIFNDDEPYASQPLEALVRDVPGAPPRTYFVTLLNPLAAVPTQLPAGERVAMGEAFFGPYGSLNLTERKTAEYAGTLAQSGGALVFGYSFQRQEGLVSNTQASRDHHGIYVNETHRFGDRIFVNAGARVEHSSVFGTEFIPRAGVSFLLFREHGWLSSTFLRFSAGRGINEPSLYENFVQSPFAVGNPALKPEKTNSYETGLVQEWARHRVLTEISAFRTSFRDLITYVYPTWQNVEASWARGIETAVHARLLPNVLVSANYVRLYTRIVTSETPADPVTGIGEPLLRRPRNSGAITLAVTPRRWSFVAGARLVGERQDSDFVGFGVNRNPGYENVFLSASYTLSRHYTPVLQIDNLLNQRYEEVLGYSALSRSIIGGVRIGW